MYTLDNGRESAVACPADLLVDIDDVDIARNGLFITHHEKYRAHREFLGKYFGFHYNAAMVNRYLEIKAQIDSLTGSELSLVSSICPGIRQRADVFDPLSFAKTEILNSHKIYFINREVLMPFVTFLNHDKTGVPYHVTREGISVCGRFADEIFARYNTGDAIDIAGMYGFTADSAMAFSLSMRIHSATGRRLVILRRTDDCTIHNGVRLPLITARDDRIMISWFPIHSDNEPGYPLQVARWIAGETGAVLPEELLNSVFRFNTDTLASAAAMLQESTNPYAKLIAEAAKRQLDKISSAGH